MHIRLRADEVKKGVKGSLQPEMYANTMDAQNPHCAADEPSHVAVGPKDPFTTDMKGKLTIIKCICKLLNQYSKNKKSKVSPSLLKPVGIDTRRISPEETRVNWRRDQICTQMKVALLANSSCCTKHLPQVIWCGYLRKGAATPWKQPTERWTEVRSEPAPQVSAISRTVVMQYRSSAQTTKRLTVSDPRREAARDIAGKAYLSVAVEGRRGRVLLSLKSGHDADTLVRCILAELRPAFSFLP